MEHVRVAVIGAGPAGIGAAVVLTRAGHDVLVLDRGRAVGGRWLDTSYPGCACDVPGDLNSFSFAPNPYWARTYPRQPEVLAYLRDVVERFGLADRIRCGVDVREATWDGGTRRWRLGTGAGRLSCEILVAAPGPSAEPWTPALPGLGGFRGRVLHTARWHEGAVQHADLAGRRVAVVGTGTSAVQLVPQLAGHAESVVVFQRTAPWILPRHDREIPEERRRSNARHPLRRRAVRYLQAGRHGFGTGPLARPVVPGLVEARCRRHLRNQVPDPGLRELLTPDGRAEGGRVQLSDDYYPALSRDDVELVASAAGRLEPDAVVAEDGSRREIDVLVLATGFAPAEMPLAHHLAGQDGRLLADVLSRTGRRSPPSGTVPGFPNLFLLTGPCPRPGEPSPLRTIEARLARLTHALEAMDRRGLSTIEPVGRAPGRAAPARQRAALRLRRAPRDAGSRS